MREFKYDVIQLIHCVRDRPCLWDKTIDNYKDRVERRNAWEEIFNKLEETYDGMTPEEKRITGEHILNKWTNVRDTFAKTLKNKMGRPKKKYLLYDHLKFLTKIIPEINGIEDNNDDHTTYMKQEIEPENSFTVNNALELQTSFTISEMEPDTSFPVTNDTSYGTKKPSKRSDFSDTQSTVYNKSEVSYSGKRRSKRSDFDDVKSTDYTTSEIRYSSQKRKSKRYILNEDMNDSTDSVSSKKKSKKGNSKSSKLPSTTIENQVNDDHSNDIDFVEVDDNDPRIMNEDEAFFASLLPTIVKYNEDERLEFRIEVLGVMKKLKDKRKWTCQ